MFRFNTFSFVNRLKYRQKACFKYIVLIYFSAVIIRFKYRQNACFKDIVFKIVYAVPKMFQIPSECMNV